MSLTDIVGHEPWTNPQFVASEEQRDLLAIMRDLHCVVEFGWCATHGSSILLHDGGRAACASAWEVLCSAGN